MSRQKAKSLDKAIRDEQRPPKKRISNNSPASIPMARVKVEAEALSTLVSNQETGQSSKTTSRSGSSPTNVFSCDSCKALFPLKHLLNKHNCSLHHFKSVSSRKSESHEEGDKIHYKNHHKLISTGEFVCDHCSCIMSNQSSMRKHISRKHGDPLRNDSSHKQTDSSDSEDDSEDQRKRSISSSSKDHSKPVSSRKSESRSESDKIQFKGHHKVISTGEFVCDYCQCVMTNQSSLRTHIKRKHDVAKQTNPSDSEDDQKIRSEKSSSRDHSKSILWHKPESRDEGDRIQFKGHHKVISTGEFVCDYCQCVMTNQSSLRAHIKRKHDNLSKNDSTSKQSDTSDSGDEPRKAHIKTLPNKDLFKPGPSLQSEAHEEGDRIQFKGHHKIVSTGEFVCDYCQCVMTNQSSLRTHINRKHDKLSKKSAPSKQMDTSDSEAEPKYQWVHCKNQPGKDEDAWPHEVLKVILKEGTTPLELDKIKVVRKFLRDSSNVLRACPCCSYKSRNRSNFRDHVRRQHREIWVKTGHAKVTTQLSESSSSKKNLEGDSDSDGSQDEQKERKSKGDRSTPKVLQTIHKCPYCPFESLVRSSLRSHVHRSHLKKKKRFGLDCQGLPPTGYACYLCSFIGCSIGSLKRHATKFHGDANMNLGQIPATTFDCDMCSFQCEGRVPMLKHIKSHKLKPNSEGRYKCEECDFDTKLAEILQTHVSMAHSPAKVSGAVEPVSCDRCDFTCINSRVMDWHKMQHDLPPDEACHTLTCNDCGLFTWNKGLLTRHIKKYHEKDVEGRGAYSGLKSEGIRNTKSRYREVPCDHCSYIAKTKSMLMFHVVRKHTGLLEHECDHCGKKFKLKYDLTRHVKVKHLDDKIYICDVCGQTYDTSNGLYTHQKYAHFKREFACHICPKRLATQANLDEHILRQHEQRQDYICEECGKVFKESRTLKAHLRVHTGLKPHVCRVCNKAFGKGSGLRQHMLTHSEQRLYICDICGKSFTQKTGLICHRKSHPGPLPPLPALPRVAVDRVLSNLLQGRE